MEIFLPRKYTESSLTLSVLMRIGPTIHYNATYIHYSAGADELAILLGNVLSLGGFHH